MHTHGPDHLNQVFAALADPTRRAMLARLAKGQANVSDLAEPFLKDMSLPAVTKHLKVLERAGLVTKTREAQRRPCTLNGAPMRDAVAWMEQYREFWEQSLDRLGEYLETLTAQSARPAAKKAKGRRNGRKR